jgi:hypothetical protein
MAGNRKAAPEVRPSPPSETELGKKVTGVKTRTRVAPETVAVARQVLSAREASPTEADREAMKNSLRRNQARGERVTVLVANMPGEDGAPRVWLGEPHNDKRGWLIRLQDAFGTHSDEFALKQLNSLATMARESGDGTVDSYGLNSMLASVDGARPQNEAEGMLAVQMATTHAFAMTCLRRANGADTIPQLEANGNLATKMLRTYAAQVEALAKLRRGGEQRVVVQHVNVNEGGQAIVGDVHNARGGGGSGEKIDRPHAPGQQRGRAQALAFTQGVPLWSEDPSRDTVSSSGREEQAPVPNARRREG